MFATRLASVALLLAWTPLPVWAVEIDPHVPPDTEFYLSVNVRQLLESPLIKKNALQAIKEALANAEEVNEVLKELGFDPFKDLDRVTVAGPVGKDADRGLMIVTGAFDVKKFEKRADTAAKDNADALKINKVPLGGGATHLVYEVSVPGQDQTLYVAVANNKTILASPGKDYVVDALKAARLKKKPLLKNKGFAAVVEKMELKQAVTIAAAGKALAGLADADGLPESVREAVGNIDAVAGGLSVGRELKLELAVSTKEERTAGSVRRSASKGVALALAGLALLGEERKELNLLIEVLKTVKVAGKGKVVSVSARLTADVLDDFFKKD
jgi:hypothetical protein